MFLIGLQTLPSLIHISWLFVSLPLHFFLLFRSLRWWGRWTCCTSSWGATLPVSRCRPCCWSGAWSSSTVCCSIQALGMRPERGSSGWEQLTGPFLNILQFITQEIFALWSVKMRFSQFPPWFPCRFYTRSWRASECRSATSSALNWRILAISAWFAVLITSP